MSDKKNKVDWTQLASEAYENLCDAQIHPDLRISEPEQTDLHSLEERKEILLGQLQNVLDKSEISDLLDIPAETEITDLQLSMLLQRELKELRSVKEHLNSNITNLEDQFGNCTKRNGFLNEIVQGAKVEAEAIENENDEDKHRMTKGMIREIREVMNIILDEAYPEMKADIKKVINELYGVKDEENPFLPVPDGIDIQVIPLLLAAKIIILHESNPNLIRLMIL